MLESDIMRQIQISATKTGARLFRNNVALAWAGNVTRVTSAGQLPVKPGDVLIRNARPIHAGLCEGSSDLIGWMPVTVTQEMVGKPLALFAAIEVKAGRGRVSEEQANFINAVRGNGGLGGVAWSVENAVEILSGGAK